MYRKLTGLGIALLVVMIAVLTIGYGLGAYFVDFALKRGNDMDPMAPPAACRFIHDKNRQAVERPSKEFDEWTARSTDGRRLAATHYSPEKSQGKWAILVHGYGIDQQYTGDYAKVYLDHGYDVLTPDLCASGKTEGQYITMGVKESEEIAIWAQQIKAKDPDAEIVLHGVSMGAATVLLAAAREDIPALTAVVEDCGYTSAYEMFSDQLKVIFDLPEFPIMPCVDVVSGLKTGAQISEAAPIKVMGRIKAPVLFVHGAEDKLIPPGMMDRLYEACTAQKEKLTIEGAGHGNAMPTNSQLYWTHIFKFISAT